MDQAHKWTWYFGLLCSVNRFLLLTYCFARRRKAAEMAGHKGDAKAVSAAVPFGSSSAAAPIPAAAASDPSQFQEVSKAKKGKKGKASKGQKVGN